MNMIQSKLEKKKEKKLTRIRSSHAQTRQHEHREFSFKSIETNCFSNNSSVHEMIRSPVNNLDIEDDIDDDNESAKQLISSARIPQHISGLLGCTSPAKKKSNIKTLSMDTSEKKKYRRWKYVCRNHKLSAREIDRPVVIIISFLPRRDKLKSNIFEIEIERF